MKSLIRFFGILLTSLIPGRPYLLLLGYICLSVGVGIVLLCYCLTECNIKTYHTNKTDGFVMTSLLSKKDIEAREIKWKDGFISESLSFEVDEAGTLKKLQVFDSTPTGKKLSAIYECLYDGLTKRESCFFDHIKAGPLPVYIAGQPNELFFLYFSGDSISFYNAEINQSHFKIITYK